MDVDCQKMVFKKFDAQKVNQFDKNAEIVSKKIEEIANDALGIHKVEILSDEIESDKSGNDSENDEMNRISVMRA